MPKNQNFECVLVIRRKFATLMTGPKRDKLGQIENYRSFICILLKNVVRAKPSKKFSIPEVLISRKFLISLWFLCLAFGLPNSREQNIKQQLGIKKHQKPVLKLTSIFLRYWETKESKELGIQYSKHTWRKVCKCLVFVYSIIF